MASSNSQIDKPQCGCPKRAELLDVNINTGAQIINSERAEITIISRVRALAVCLYLGSWQNPKTNRLI